MVDLVIWSWADGVPVAGIGPETDLHQELRGRVVAGIGLREHSISAAADRDPLARNPGLHRPDINRAQRRSDRAFIWAVEQPRAIAAHEKKIDAPFWSARIDEIDLDVIGREIQILKLCVAAAGDFADGV